MITVVYKEDMVTVTKLYNILIKEFKFAINLNVLNF